MPRRRKGEPQSRPITLIVLRPFLNHAPGDKIKRDPGIAEQLIRRGFVRKQTATAAPATS